MTGGKREGKLVLPALLVLAMLAGSAGAASAMQGMEGHGPDAKMEPGPGNHPGCMHGKMGDKGPEGMECPMRGGGMGMGMMGMDLKLTEPQREKLKADRLARGKRMIALRAEAATLQLELREAEMDAKLDVGKIETLANKLGQTKAKMIVERAKGREFFESLLTPEQKKELADRPGRGPCGPGPDSEE